MSEDKSIFADLIGQLSGVIEKVELIKGCKTDVELSELVDGWEVESAELKDERNEVVSENEYLSEQLASFEDRTTALQAELSELKEKLSLYEWKDIPDDHLFPTGRYLIEIVDEDGPLVHLMEVEQTFTAIGGCLSFNMPGKRTRYMALPTPPSTQEGDKE